MLGVRILPKKNEFLAGYLLRLADVNGLPSIEHLVKLISTEKINLLIITKSRSYQIESFLADLALALNISLDDLKNHLQNYFIPYSYLHARDTCVDICITEPRICIECIKMGEVIDSRMSMPIFSSCAKHNVNYICHCPTCQHPFSWNCDVLVGCRKCGTQWNNVANLALNVPSELETKMWEEINQITNKTEQKVADVLEAVFAMARPFDTFPDRFFSLPKCKNLNNHIINAYEILTSQKALNDWATSCIEERSLLSAINDEVVFAPIEKLRQRLKLFKLNKHVRSNSPDDIKSNIQFMESSDFIRASRAKTLKSNDDINARFHVNRRQMEKQLGLQENDLLKAVQSGSIRAVNGNIIAREQIFNIKNTFEKIKMTATEPSVQLVDTKDVQREMRMHLCSRSMVINAILTKVLIGGVYLKGDATQLLVDVSSFKQWLKTEFSKRCEGSVSIQQAATALCTSPLKIKDLIEKGTLKYPPWTRSVTQITGISLVPHWSKVHGIPIEQKLIELH